MAYIARSLTALLERTPTDKAIVVFGARQTGKTTLLKHLFQDRKVKWLSGDEPQDRELLTSLSSKADISILLSGLDVLVIDEAQRIQGIGMLLKRLEDSKPSCRIFATGSSSLELAGGVMESAAGRLWPMTLFPLSVSELADHNSWLDVMESLPIRLTVGSYPEIVTHPQRSKATLRYLFESIVFKDLFAIAGIRRSEQFLHLVRLLAANIGNLCSFSSLGQQCGLSSPTVERCVSLLEQSFIVKTLPCYSSNFATELKKSKKITFTIWASETPHSTISRHSHLVVIWNAELSGKILSSSSGSNGIVIDKTKPNSTFGATATKAKWIFWKSTKTVRFTPLNAN